MRGECMLREKYQKSIAFEKTEQWTRVSTALPEQKESIYLVVINGSFAFAWFRKNESGLWQFNKADVTHWMKIPEVPKDEEKSVSMEMES